jgi:hypothetical protein
MGRHRHHVDTSAYDEVRGLSAEELRRLPDETLYRLEVMREQLLRASSSRRGLSPAPEELSMVLPYPLGVVPPGEDCTSHHHAVWQAATVSRRFNHWFYQHATTPRRVADECRSCPEQRPEGMERKDCPSTNTLINHLVGKSTMQTEVLLKWERMCGGVREIQHPDPRIYCWRNGFYRWPTIPKTVASQQANFSYPTFLADGAIEVMYGYGDPCYCRVLAWVDDLAGYQRTGRPEFDRVVIGTTSAVDGRLISALDAFRRLYWQDDPQALRRKTEADPNRAVADYLRWELDPQERPEPPGFLRRPGWPPEWALGL